MTKAPLCGEISIPSTGIFEGITCGLERGHAGKHRGTNGRTELIWKSAEDLYGPEEKRTDSSP